MSFSLICARRVMTHSSHFIRVIMVLHESGRQIVLEGSMCDLNKCVFAAIA